MDLSNSVYWLLAGAALLAIEVFGIPGIGFLFAGFAAILVGMLVEIGLIGELAIITQCAIFFILTTALAALLWKKLKSWRVNPNAPHYSNMLGTEAKVIGLLTHDSGAVKWSGTTMRAKLVKGAGVNELTDGTTVIIIAVEGNVFTVAPK